jgi:anthranilate phosphoribosyltransferase
LGPLSNPARATHQLLGVYDEKLTEPLAMVLDKLGLKHALVVHGRDGLDEATITSETIVSELKDRKVRNYEIKPEDFGIKRVRLEDLKGGDVAPNVKIANDILNGKTSSCRDIVLLNAACAIYVGDKAKDFKEGIRLACESIDTGKALKKLEELKEYTNKCS